MSLEYTLVSVVIPVHNQAEHISDVVTKFEEVLKRIPTPHELLLIPNGCTDESEEVCKGLQRRFSNIRTLPTQTAGWGAAVKRGIHGAKGDLICYTNAARTTPEELALAVLYASTFKGVIIKANRKIRENFLRRVGSLLYNLQCRLLFDLAHWDINGTPKVFPRSCDRLMSLECDDDLIDLEFNIISRRMNYPMLELPIYSYRRHGGKSTTRWRSAGRLYYGAFRLWYRLSEKGIAENA